MNTEPTYSNCCGAQMPQAEGERCPRCKDHCEAVLSDNARWSAVGPEPRTAGRRFIDTQDALDYARSKGASAKRIAVLEKGYAMLDAEFNAEVRADLTRDLFKTIGDICRPVSFSPLIGQRA